jgi:hypothetical protein
MATLYDTIIGNVALIQLVIIVGGLTFSAGYLMPRGILFFMKWKGSKKNGDLAASATYCASAIFIFGYLLAMAIIDSAKVFFG